MPDWITTREAAKLSGFHPEYVHMVAQFVADCVARAQAQKKLSK